MQQSLNRKILTLTNINYFTFDDLLIKHTVEICELLKLNQIKLRIKLSRSQNSITGRRLYIACGLRKQSAAGSARMLQSLQMTSIDTYDIIKVIFSPENHSMTLHVSYYTLLTYVRSVWNIEVL